MEPTCFTTRRLLTYNNYSGSLHRARVRMIPTYCTARARLTTLTHPDTLFATGMIPDLFTVRARNYPEMSHSPCTRYLEASRNTRRHDAGLYYNTSNYYPEASHDPRALLIPKRIAACANMIPKSNASHVKVTTQFLTTRVIVAPTCSARH